MIGLEKWKLQRGYRVVGQAGIMRAYYDADARFELPRLPALTLEAESTLMRKLTVLVILSMLLTTSACVYKASISQGNLVKQENLDQIEVGMTRSQIRYLLGTPMVDDPFHADRWDYVYYLKIGRKDATFKRWVSVVFEDDEVTEIRRDQELDPKL
jgi:outer membrane protein assembly factor BamE